MCKGRVTCPPNLSLLTLRHTTTTPSHPSLPPSATNSHPSQLSQADTGTALWPEYVSYAPCPPDVFFGVFLSAAVVLAIVACLFVFCFFFLFLMPHWFLILPHSSICLLLGMSHEPKSPSLGMISTATRTTATVSPLTPSPLNGSIVANGSPATQSAHSGFAAALRKLAKQAEEPRGKTRRLI